MFVQLPPSVIMSLYKDSLVLIEETATKTNKKQQQVTNKTANAELAALTTAKKWFLGDNKKNIALIVSDAGSVYINDEWLATLTKLLAACKLTLADIAIVNLKQQQNFSIIKDQLQPQYVLLFDVNTSDLELPFSIPHYQLQNYGGCIFMTAPSITLADDKTTPHILKEKRNLWNKLKAIFPA